MNFPLDQSLKEWLKIFTCIASAAEYLFPRRYPPSHHVKSYIHSEWNVYDTISDYSNNGSQISVWLPMIRNSLDYLTFHAVSWPEPCPKWIALHTNSFNKNLIYFYVCKGNFHDSAIVEHSHKHGTMFWDVWLVKPLRLVLKGPDNQ